MERLVDQAPDDWTILANLRVTTPRQDYELDLVILMPDIGVVVAEVKGGSVHVDTEGQWKQSSGGSTRAIHPSIRRATASTPCATTWRPIRAGGPNAPAEFVSATLSSSPHESRQQLLHPDCPRWLVHGRDDQGISWGRLYDIAVHQESAYRAPTVTDCALIVDILHGRNLPQRDVPRPLRNANTMPSDSPWNRPPCSASPGCCTASRSAAVPAQARPPWPSPRLGNSPGDVAVTVCRSASPWSATPSDWRAT